MFSPKYLLRLEKQHFDNNRVVCLGKQLFNILSFIEPLIPPQIWYGADIDANFKSPNLLKFAGFVLRKIGDISVLKTIAIQTDQFLSGVFIAITKDILISDDVIEASTEDLEYRLLDIEGIIVEIRAFDTAYFEIYSDNYELMNNIATHFHAEMLKK